MCTAATYQTKDFYFGRNLDYEFPYGESVTITPRGYSFDLRRGEKFKNRYAIIGMAHVQDGYPLYYDAVNEKGLCIAGLNFVGNAKYHTPVNGKDNITQFELIPWLLGSCAGIAEARTMLERLNVTDIPFSAGMPLAQLHWLIADRTGSITVESTADGLHIYDNPVGVLANNPPFPMKLFSLNNYMALSPQSPKNTFAPDAPLSVYSRGMGALVCSHRVVPASLVLGGAQERGHRAGTSNVAGAAGMAAALDEACDRLEANTSQVEALRERFVRSLASIEGVRVLGPTDPSLRLPGIVAITLDGVDHQGLGAGLGGLQVQIPVNVPPLAVQHLIEAGGVVPIDGEAPGGVDVGVGIDKARHDDAATSVHKFRLGVLGLQIRGGADLHDLAAIGDHAAVRQVADALRIPGDDLAVCQ